jgi:hypothetical protein
LEVNVSPPTVTESPALIEENSAVSTSQTATVPLVVAVMVGAVTVPALDVPLAMDNAAKVVASDGISMPATPVVEVAVLLLPLMPVVTVIPAVPDNKLVPFTEELVPIPATC